MARELLRNLRHGLKFTRLPRPCRQQTFGRQADLVKRQASAQEFTAAPDLFRFRVGAANAEFGDRRLAA